MAGVPRSYEYMFVAYVWAELYREKGISPPMLEEIGYPKGGKLYKGAFKRVSLIHDAYVKVHGKESAEKSYLNSISTTVQEYWERSPLVAISAVLVVFLPNSGF